MIWDFKNEIYEVEEQDFEILTTFPFTNNDIEQLFHYNEFYKDDINAFPLFWNVPLFIMLSNNPKNIQSYWAEYRRLIACSKKTIKHYKNLDISKRNSNKKRNVKVVSKYLEFYQRRILHEVINKIPSSKNAYAYKKKVSVKDNASMHIGKPLLVKLDIVGFFDSITYPKVYNAFKEYTPYSKPVMTLFSNLCCYQGHLPQGSCISPALSNLCFLSCDKEIEKYCNINNITYTRYSDDMTFSGDFNPGKLIKFVRGFLLSRNFILNDEKTKILPQGTRQIVTGITVNRKLQVPKYTRKRIRQEIYFIRQYGVVAHMRKINDPKFIKDNRLLKRTYLQSLEGRINYGLHINPKDSELMEYKNFVLQLMRPKHFAKKKYEKYVI